MEEKLIQIIKKMTGVDFEDRNDLRDTNLFSDKIGLCPRDLVALCVTVAEEFGINIKEVNLNLTKFDTFNHILLIVKRYGN